MPFSTTPCFDFAFAAPEHRGDRTTTIRASVHDSRNRDDHLVILVIFVVFAFLRNVWAPSSPVSPFRSRSSARSVSLYLCHYSLDNLSLMALTICTGFVVDDCHRGHRDITRHIESGMKPYEAAMKGASEIGFTVLSIALRSWPLHSHSSHGGIVGRFSAKSQWSQRGHCVSLLISLSTRR